VRAVDRKIGGRAPQRALLSNRIIYTASRVASSEGEMPGGRGREKHQGKADGT